jgi:hypothetical protein
MVFLGAEYDIVYMDDSKVYLIDLNLGAKSITNDAERVYEEIQKKFPGKRLIYRDSMGQWDEIVLLEQYLYDQSTSPEHWLCHQSIDFKPYKGEIPDVSGRVKNHEES